MADAVKISELPGVSSFGAEDLFVVNDITGADEVTSKISVGSVVAWITDQDLAFSKTLQISNIIPDPEEGLYVTVNGIYVKDNIIVDPFAVISGIRIDDLDDVTIDDGLLAQGQTLVWNSQDSSWVNDFLSVDNADDTVTANLDLLRDSIDTLNDSIDILNDLLSDKVDPAPSDGGYYAMQDGQWVNITEILTPLTKYLVYDDGVAST